ncbi:hypothetical protein DFJ74DRAFT_657733 [Hyaloraphidium curvatum]|nr:hypothetical protein DFJ74DRAFT_657733 [Hyaloraphidium curvatum]
MDPCRVLEGLLSQYLSVDDASVHKDLRTVLSVLVGQNLLRRAADAASTTDGTGHLGKRRRAAETALSGPRRTEGSSVSAWSSVQSKWTTRVASLCSSDVTSARLAGLSLASASADQLPHLVETQLATWSSSGLATLNRPTTKAAKAFVVEALSALYRSTKAFPDVTRAVTATHVPKFLATALSIVRADASLAPRCLHAMGSLMAVHPGICKLAIQSIQTGCLELVERAATTEDAGIAIRILSQTVGLLGRAGAAEAWSSMAERALGSCHDELGALLQCVQEEQAHAVYTGELLLPRLDDGSDEELFALLERRLARVSCFLLLLSNLYELELDVHVRTPAERTLALLSRIFAVSPATAPKSAGYKLEATVLIGSLPRLYPLCTELMIAMCSRIRDLVLQCSSVTRNLIRRIIGFSDEKPLLRHAAYTLVEKVAMEAGVGCLYVVVDTILESVLGDLGLIANSVAALQRDTEARLSATDVGGKRSADKGSATLAAGRPRLCQRSVKTGVLAARAAAALVACMGTALDSELRAELDSLVTSMLFQATDQLPSELAVELLRYCSISCCCSGAALPSHLTSAAQLTLSGSHSAIPEIRATSNDIVLRLDPLFRPRLPPLQRVEEANAYGVAPTPAVTSQSLQATEAFGLPSSLNAVALATADPETSLGTPAQPRGGKGPDPDRTEVGGQPLPPFDAGEQLAGTRDGRSSAIARANGPQTNRGTTGFAEASSIELDVARPAFSTQTPLVATELTKPEPVKPASGAAASHRERAGISFADDDSDSDVIPDIVLHGSGDDSDEGEDRDEMAD